MTTNSAKDDVTVIAKRWKNKRGSLIMALHGLQNRFGYVPREAAMNLAEQMDVPLARIYEVITFYNYFKLKSPGKHVVSVCKGTACYVKGAEQIQTTLESHHQCKFGQTTKNNKVSFITARCVGSCGLAPVAVLDNAVVGKLTPEESLRRVEQMKNSVPAEDTVVQEAAS